MTATVGTALQSAIGRLPPAGLDTANLDPRLLPRDVLQAETAELVAHPERPLADGESERFHDLIERRCRHQPVSQLLARREFWGLTFRVTADTLIPRPETETVVEAALAGIADRGQALRILDLGTGTGCLLLALLHELPQATGIGVDRSPGAVAVARREGGRPGTDGARRFPARQLDRRAGREFRPDRRHPALHRHGRHGPAHAGGRAPRAASRPPWRARWPRLLPRDRRRAGWDPASPRAGGVGGRRPPTRFG